MNGTLSLQGYAGREVYAVRVLGYTGRKARVQLTCDVMLPGKRMKQAGSIVLVPRHAVKVEAE